MLAFAIRTNAMAGLDEFYFWGYMVSRFLSAVDSDARAAYKLRHPTKPRHRMDAKGAAARGGQAAACLFLARNLSYLPQEAWVGDGVWSAGCQELSAFRCTEAEKWDVCAGMPLHINMSLLIFHDSRFFSNNTDVTTFVSSRHTVRFHET